MKSDGVQFASASAAIALAAVLAATAAGASDEPSLSPELRALRESEGKICLRPLANELGQSVPRWEPKRAWIEQFVLEKLGDGGFATLGAAEVVRVERTVRGALGGAYDPHTGARDWAVERAIERALRERLVAEFGCAGILEARVISVRTGWDGDKARWDGATRDLGDLLAAVGYAMAVSLEVELFAPDERVLHRGSGGVQLAHFVSDHRLHEAPPEGFLDYPEWNAEAVITALGPLGGEISEGLARCLSDQLSRQEEFLVKRRRARAAEAIAWARDLRAGRERRALCEAEQFHFTEPEPNRLLQTSPDAR